MKKIVVLLGAFCAMKTLAFSPDTTVWLDQAAKVFTESTPLGNGRLGAMDFGGTETENIVLNEDSLWSGSVQDADRTNAVAVLPEIRRLLLENKNEEAESLVNKNFTCAGRGSGNGRSANLPYGSYEVLGNLWLKYQYIGLNDVTGYRRMLDLSTATADTVFSRAGVKYEREMFVSAPDQAVVIRLTADRPGMMNLSVGLDRSERYKTIIVGKDLLMTGTMTNGAGGDGVKYAARVRVVNKGGVLVARDGKIEVSGADEVLIFVTAATDYERFGRVGSRDVAAAALKDLKQASKKSYAELKAAHVADYQKYFDRVKL
jgi:alpha-L-fucosidase 2